MCSRDSGVFKICTKVTLYIPYSSGMPGECYFYFYYNFYFFQALQSVCMTFPFMHSGIPVVNGYRMEYNAGQMSSNHAAPFIPLELSLQC